MAKRLGGRFKQEIALIAFRMPPIRRTCSVLLLATLLAVGCSGGFALPRTSGESSVVVHSGTIATFFNLPCVQIDANDPDIDSKRLRDLLLSSLQARRLVSRSRCSSSDRVLRVMYRVGPGVCIDCLSNAKSRSGFAFLVVQNRDATEDFASAEWQYWGGGTMKDALGTFLADLTELRAKSCRPQP